MLRRKTRKTAQDSIDHFRQILPAPRTCTHDTALAARRGLAFLPPRDGTSAALHCECLPRLPPDVAAPPQAIVASLLAAGCAADPIDGRGRTPLHDACDGDEAPGAPHQNMRHGSMDASGDGGVGSRRSTGRGKEEAEERARCSRLNVARLLVNAGADPGSRIVASARKGRGGEELTAANGNTRASDTSVMGFQESGNQQQKSGEVGMTALHLACRSGRAEIAGYLIRTGASVSHRAAGQGAECLYLGWLRGYGDTPGIWFESDEQGLTLAALFTRGLAPSRALVLRASQEGGSMRRPLRHGGHFDLSWRKRRVC